MNQKNKRLLESPESCENTAKICRGEVNPTSVLLKPQSPVLLKPQSPEMGTENNKDDIVQAIRDSIAEEFRKHDMEKIDPIIRDVAEIKNDIRLFKEERSADQERIRVLERETKNRNIIFFNVPYTQDANRSIIEICKGALKIQEELGIEKSVTLKTNANNQKMTILVEFGSQRFADMVIRNSKLLKNTGIGVARDLCKEDREIRSKLLRIRKIVREKDTSQKVNVYGNVIVVNDIKLTYYRDFFGNKRLNINGYNYFLEKFDINCEEIFECKQ